MIVLGIDGGASKTHAVLADGQGNVVGVGRAGCSNWEIVDLDGAKRALQKAIGQALADAGISAGQIDAAGYGLAGLDCPSDEGRLKPVVESLGIDASYALVNDAFLPLRAGTTDGIGLGAIAGSGTTVVGRNRDGKTDRSFGVGYPLTDWGGAGDIVTEAVHAVALAYRGMGPETSLAERLLRATKCADLAELFEKVMRWQLDLGGRFAPQVFEAAHEGDVVAQSIVRRVGTSIGANAISVAGNLGMLDEAFPLVTAGGVFSSRSDLLNDSLLKAIRAKAPQAYLVYWDSHPVVGAMLLAFDLVALASLPSTELMAVQRW